VINKEISSKREIKNNMKAILRKEKLKKKEKKTSESKKSRK